MSNLSFNDFYDLIQSMTGEIEVEILKAQRINNVLSFLRSKDLYSIFKLDCEEFDDLKRRASIRLKNGDYIIRPTIKDNFDYCLNFFKNVSSDNQTDHQLDIEHFQKGLIGKDDTFMSTFISNLFENMNRSKYNYQYNNQMRKFGAAVFGLGGRNVYEFLRMNLPGGFPSIPTLELYTNEYCTRIEEGQFRFDELKNHFDQINCAFACGSEDCTTVVSKVQYDTDTNSFVGFCGSFTNGLPSIRQYQTDSFQELEDWFDTINQSTLINIHMVQPISNSSSAPFLLNGFGTDNSYNAISIISRWLYIYDHCYEKNIRIIGFSSDADPKFLKAMRLITGYFSRLPNINLFDRDNIFCVTIPNSWSNWFFLRLKQVFLCMQDSMHIATKLRNRLLSKSASLIMGSYRVTSKDLEDLIQNESKFHHGLVLSDLYVKDEQNYMSCVKISSSNVLNFLDKNKQSFATHCYLSILSSIITGYINRTTNVLDRIYHAWFTVFMSRIWLMWLLYKLKNDLESNRYSRRPSLRLIEEHFMTFPAFYSIELNSHCFTYIVLLVIDKKLPVESLNIFLFSSQPCENMFRSARAINGPFSSITNFSIHQFFSKTRKISILNEIKSSEDFNKESNAIKFPKHHKMNKDTSTSSTSSNTIDLTLEKIEKRIHEAFEYAKTYAEKLEMSSILLQNDIFDMNSLCKNLRDYLEDSMFMTDESELDNDEEIEDDDSNENSSENIHSEDECIEAEDACVTSKKENYNGMRVYSMVADQDKNKFFKIDINGVQKFLHKQTGAWLLTKKNTRLSSDRLIRVEQANQQ